jgi:hypothetical protein
MLFPNHDWNSSVTESGMQFTNMCWKYMRFKKASKGFRCCVCRAEHKPGIHYIGDSYNKICMKCAPTYMKNTIDGFNIWLEHIQNNIDIFKTNEQKWMKEVLAGAIEHSND